VIVVNERHLRAILSEFVGYYNAHGPHRSLDLETPRRESRTRAGPIRVRSVLGGFARHLRAGRIGSAKVLPLHNRPAA